MAKLTTLITVTDVPTNSAAAPTTHTITSATMLSCLWEMGKPETVAYRAVGADTSVLNPGQAPGGTRVIALSLDNGAHQDTRMLSNGAQLVDADQPYVGESGAGLGQALATARTNRLSVQQATLRDVLTAAAGQMAQQSSPSNTLLPSPNLPSVAGLGVPPIGPAGSTQATALGFTYVVDQAVQTLPLDIDVNTDTKIRSLENLTEHMGSLTDPQRAQFVIDSGDYGVTEGQTASQTVTVGHLGQASRFTFDGTTLTAVPQMVMRGTQGQASTTDMAYSCKFDGGSTRHGMPDGATITAVKTTNRQWLVDTGDYRIGLPVLGIYVDRDHGGLYTWPGDGDLHPASQAMGVTDLWYDESIGALYVATDAGVYLAAGFTGGNATLPRLGTMALKIAKLCKDNGVLYALATWADGSTHVLRYPAAAGALSGQGYDGWSIVTSATGIADFAVAAGIGAATLYYITSAAGSDGVIHRVVIGTGAATTIDVPKVAVKGDVAATGLDPVTILDGGSTVQGIFVRTSQGSAGLYYIDCSVTPGTVPYAAGAGLLDAFGTPVTVNAITAHPGGIAAAGFAGGANVVGWDDGRYVGVGVWAATNRGVYASVLGVGSFNWRRTDGQSNIGDYDVQMVASAAPRKYLGQWQTRVYAITPSAILQSNDGTLHFVDMLALPLSTAPAWWARYLKANGDYPPVGVTSLVYNGFTRLRQLDGLGHIEHISANTASQAPAWAHRDAVIPQFATSSLVSEIRGSQVLMDAEGRYLAFTAQAQEIWDVDSAFDDTDDALRTLRPTQMVTLQATFSMEAGSHGTITYATVNGIYYVLSHGWTVDGGTGEPGIARTKTRIAKLCLDSRADPARIVGDMMYQATRQSKYLSGR